MIEENVETVGDFFYTIDDTYVRKFRVFKRNEEEPRLIIALEDEEDVIRLVERLNQVA